MNMIKSMVCVLSVFMLTSACSLFKSDKPAEQKQNVKDKSKGGKSIQGDWSSRIGKSSTYSIDNATTGQSQYGGHSDRIGRGQIEQLKMAGPSSAPKIAAFLSDPSLGVRQKAVEALGEFGQKASAALPRILRLLSCSNPELRLSAAHALALMKLDKSEDYLENALDDPSILVRAWAHAGLVRLGQDCEDHQDDTAKILSASPGKAPMEAMNALGLMKCASEDAIGSLMDALDSPHESIRSAAARALGNIGAPAGRSVAKLNELLKEKSFRVRLSALLALGHMGQQGLKAIDGLIACLSDPSPKFRQLAAFAIGQIGPRASSGLQALDKATHDSDAAVATAAKKAMVKITSSSKP